MSAPTAAAITTTAADDATAAHHPRYASDGGRWVMEMIWHDLLFMHWPIKSDLIRPLIPASLRIDTFDKQAWLGVVPFRMTGVRLRHTPALPWLSAFPELNVRTYVEHGGRHGVWFFSLDAANYAAVWGARTFFHLPYFNAQMRVEEANGEIRYRSTRTHRGAAPATFFGSYGPRGDVGRSSEGTLDHWLTERYCLYAANKRGRTFRCDIHHYPWPLQPAESEIPTNTMTEQIGITLPSTEPLLHFARRLDVVASRLRPV